MKDNITISMFDQIDMGIDIKEESEKEVKKDIPKEVKKGSTTSDKAKKITPDVAKKIEQENQTEKVQKQCAEYEKIVVIYFTQEILTIDNKEDIKNIKLEDIKTTLVNGDYPELASGNIVWHLAPSPDKKIGYLFAVGDFFAKG